MWVDVVEARGTTWLATTEALALPYAMGKELMMGFRDNVQALLAQRGWSQRELAVAAGISPGAVGSILEGESSNLRTVAKVAAAFGVEVADLMREERPMEPKDELDVALRHQGDLSADDIEAVHAFLSYIRNARPQQGKRGR